MLLDVCSEVLLVFRLPYRILRGDDAQSVSHYYDYTTLETNRIVDGSLNDNVVLVREDCTEADSSVLRIFA